MFSKSKAIFGLLKRIKKLNSAYFKDRLYAQKIVYILQEGFDLNLGYTYNWYLYGPYSTELADDFYQIKENTNLKPTTFKSEKDEKIFKDAISFFHELKPNRDEIELFSSIIYMNKHLKLEKNEAINSIHLRKPRFSKKEIQEAWNKLLDYNLI